MNFVSVQILFSVQTKETFCENEHEPGSLVPFWTRILILNVEWNRIPLHITVVGPRNNTAEQSENVQLFATQ